MQRLGIQHNKEDFRVSTNTLNRLCSYITTFIRQFLTNSLYQCLYTPSIRFDDSMQALEWKQMFEQSKINNCNVRRGVGVPDAAAVDDVTSTFKSLSTATAASPSK
mmetsp:Transcript_5528/g.11637  ORF Transcript_5528/g.11637 Transcript_5528/m.11637 type:complete len:106 (+) Transcript_5528:670-987(+)